MVRRFLVMRKLYKFAEDKVMYKLYSFNDILLMSYRDAVRKIIHHWRLAKLRRMESMKNNAK